MYRRRSSGTGWLVAVVILVLGPAVVLSTLATVASAAGPVLAAMFQVPPPGSPGPSSPAHQGGGGRATRACPVDGRVSFVNSWHAPRGGGTRRHQGVDMMARTGTKLVAVESGRIGPRWGNDGGNAGIRLWLYGNSGTRYFYAHNSRNLIGPGARVKRGQHIADVGATGNANGGAPHVHFQLHPGGGRPVNPYPSVRRWC